MRTRLLIGTVFLTLATIVAFFVPAAIALADAERDAQVVELLQEASDAAVRLLPPVDDVGVADPPAPANHEDRAANGERGHFYSVYDGDGRRIRGTGPQRADRAVREALDGRSTTLRLGSERVAAVPLPAGGAVRAAEPATEADQATRAAVIRLGLQALFIMAAGVAAAWILAQRLARPLARLRESAARLGGGDFTATARPTGVAEIDDVAAALNTSADRIGALVERERRLTADVSHQLRTPITGLRLAIEGELAHPRADPADVLEESLGAVDRLEATVIALTELARGGVAADPTDVREALSEADQRWRPVFARAGRALSVGEAPGTRTSARRPAIAAILDVVLENALRHGAGNTRLGASTATGSILISVVDAGSCRLDEADLFERHRSSTGSTGIGLDLARTLAEGEGGRLRLANRSPTTFQLQVPLSREGATP